MQTAGTLVRVNAGVRRRRHGLTALAAATLVAGCVAGCATGNGEIDHPPEIGREIGEDIEITLARPDDVAGPPASRPGKGLRRSVGFVQAAVLYARSRVVDPLIRPFSHLKMRSSVVLKSATGFITRSTIGTVQFPALESRPVPPVAARPGMDLEAWEDDLDRIVGQSSRTRGSIEFLVDGEEYFTRLLEAVEGAERSIDIRTYIFDNDDFAVEVADLLRRKSDDVEVRVLLDGIGELLALQIDSETMPATHAVPLSMPMYLRNESKVKVRTRPNPWFTGDHTKTTIIDEKIAFAGGMNVGREYRYDWHDLMMELRGPIVDILDYESDKAWVHTSPLGDLGLLTRTLMGRIDRADDEGVPLRVLYTRDFDSEIYRAQLEAIRNARRYILIENAYFSDDLTLYELAKARRRGVDVHVILPEEGNHGAMNRSNRLAINRMLANGIRVYQYPGMSHVKAAIYDGWACAGSANLDKLSMQINKELNIATSDPDTVDKLLRQVFIPDLRVSREVTVPVETDWTESLAEFAADELL